MKKTLLYVCLLISIFGSAQNNDYYNRMQHIFGNIDTNKVTTGFLKDFGIRFANMEECGGDLTANNYVNENEWQLLYNSL
ncbi:hypothetical protein LX97_01346 [Nonlabens dokdonensis]|nr:hypothetical protein [Nonlabens dokdonensis]PZX44335.1 hypothetical protein LX97_01346 [Nonlabens dokdonensis]